MIFLMSKRVFLNIICPLSKKETLLNATYYIADCLSPDRAYNNGYQYDEDGNLEEVRGMMDVGIKTPSIFNVRYGNNCINPGPFITTFLTDNGGVADIEERWMNVLTSYSTMADVQEQLYLPQRRGNGILFIIYHRDENIINFGGMISEYLAKNFGEDVTFVDSRYRPYVKGQYLYKGDIMNARKVGRNIQEAKMMYSFLSCVTNSYGIDESISNMSVYLQAFNMVDLIKLYNLMWPNEPLPPSNYSVSDLKEIIMGKVIESGQVGSNVSDPNRLNIIESYDPNSYFD